MSARQGRRAGLRVRNGCCYHGVSLNVDMDLSPFSAINPCGYAGMAVTQTKDLGIALTPPQAAEALTRHLIAQLEKEAHERTWREAEGRTETARIPIKIVPHVPQKKPEWIRVKAGNSPAVSARSKAMLREQKLHTVCEEAACPNIGECFGRGTATFMILGDICTRRCPFCDVGHGKPLPPDPTSRRNSPTRWPTSSCAYVVITSVDRDDLRDGGAQHFVDVIAAVRASPTTTIETLVPDFRGRHEIAIDVLGQSLPDVLNHNMETVPRLYKQARPGADLPALADLHEGLQGQVSRTCRPSPA